MKKFLSLAVLVAAMTAMVGCNDSKTTGGPTTKVSPANTVTVTKTP